MDVTALQTSPLVTAPQRQVQIDPTVSRKDNPKAPLLTQAAFDLHMLHHFLSSLAFLYLSQSRSVPGLINNRRVCLFFKCY